jgi:arsenical pump membrane protein
MSDGKGAAERAAHDAESSAAGDYAPAGWVGWLLAGAGGVAAIVAASLNAGATADAAAQVWPPFVLVAGLLLIGVVADEDGLFASAGQRLARVASSGVVLFAGAAVMIGVVTALLNLDTSVALLTPVLVYAARSRGEGETPLLYGCLLLSNAGSLFLPGSNLTNLIVLGHLRLTGGQFFGHMWGPALAAMLATAAVVAWVERRSLGIRVEKVDPAQRFVFGLGLAAVVAATVLVVILRNAAIPVAAVGLAAVSVRVATGREQPQRVLRLLSIPVLVGLFGVSVALGCLGRVWSGPADLLAHLDLWGTGAVAAVSAVLLNNLPAASILAARRPEHPFALLVGLNVGPNLFVSGSLAWILWLRAAHTAGTRPSITKAARLGIVAVPLAMVIALGTLALSGSG